MTRDQRYLAILALGAACWSIANAVNDWLVYRGTDGGWFNYAPGNGVAYSPNSSWLFRELAVWLTAIAVWFVASRRLLRSADTKD